MSFDIKIFVEKRVGGRWIHQPLARGNERRSQYPPGFFGEKVTFGYRSFAILADMTNQERELKPISPPRGLPADISDFVRAVWNTIGEDIHPSHLTLQELLEFCWDAPIQPKQNIDTFDGYKDSILQIYAQETRTPTYREFSGELIHEELISRLVPLGSPDDTRVVFWFSS